MVAKPDRWPMSSSDRGPILEFMDRALLLEPDSLGALAALAGDVLGACSGRLFVVDYALRCVRELHGDGTTGVEFMLDGTIAGRAFASGVPVELGEGPVTVWVPVAEGSERIGVLELIFDELESWESAVSDVGDVTRMRERLTVSRFHGYVLRGECVLHPRVTVVWSVPPSPRADRYSGSL